MAIVKIYQDLCNGYGICIEDCLTDVFRKDPESGKAYIRYIEDCRESCDLCELECPVPGAIERSPEIKRKMYFAYQC